jgi:hypothetical protein
MTRIANRACYLLLPCLTYSSTLMMEEICSHETSVDFQQITRRYMEAVRTLCDEISAKTSRRHRQDKLCLAQTASGFHGAVVQ